ncbi:MAG: hypothetical protein ACOC9P_00895 [bacterium]
MQRRLVAKRDDLRQLRDRLTKTQQQTRLGAGSNQLSEAERQQLKAAHRHLAAVKGAVEDRLNETSRQITTTETRIRRLTPKKRKRA